MTANPSVRSNERILGVHITGSHVYLALQADDGSLEDHSDLRRIDPSAYMEIADSLLDFFKRFQQLLRSCQPERVALLHTRNYRPNSYSDAFRRASIETTLMVASRAEGVIYNLVRQEDAAKMLSLPSRWTARQLADAASGLVAGRPVYWGERSLAFAAAATIAQAED